MREVVDHVSLPDIDCDMTGIGTADIHAEDICRPDILDLPVDDHLEALVLMEHSEEIERIRIPVFGTSHVGEVDIEIVGKEIPGQCETIPHSQEEGAMNEMVVVHRTTVGN